MFSMFKSLFLILLVPVDGSTDSKYVFQNCPFNVECTIVRPDATTFWCYHSNPTSIERQKNRTLRVQPILLGRQNSLYCCYTSNPGSCSYEGTNCISTGHSINVTFYAHATIQEERCSPGNTCNVPISGSQSATLQPRITSYPESSSSLSRNPVTPKWTLMYDGNSVECMDSQCSRGLKVPKIGLHVNFTDGDDNQKNAIVSLETDMSISQTALLTFEIINADSPAIESCSQPTSLTSTVTYTLQLSAAMPTPTSTSQKFTTSPGPTIAPIKKEVVASTSAPVGLIAGVTVGVIALLILLATVIITIVVSLVAVRRRNKSSLSIESFSSHQENGNAERRTCEQSGTKERTTATFISNGNGHITPQALIIPDSVTSRDFADSFRLATKASSNAEYENKSDSINSNSDDDIISISHYPSFSGRKKTGADDNDNRPYEC